MNENPTKQRKPSFGKGGVPTPPGFEAHPERRHNGSWRKADTPRYKLEQMMKLDDDTLQEIAKDKTRPTFERKLAKFMHDGSWKEYADMINQVYGQPKATNETVISGELTQKTNPYEGFTKEELKELLKK